VVGLSASSFPKLYFAKLTPAFKPHFVEPTVDVEVVVCANAEAPVISKPAANKVIFFMIIIFVCILLPAISRPKSIKKPVSVSLQAFIKKCRIYLYRKLISIVVGLYGSDYSFIKMKLKKYRLG